MHAVFRADASVNIGTGHVMRCLAIAAALRNAGVDTTFISKTDEGNLCALVEAQGHAVIRLPAQAMNAHADAQQTLSVLASRPAVDWLIVDHYGLDAQWESALRQNVGNLLVIDDLADRPHDCSLLLDQNYCAGMEDRYDGLVPPECKLMLGPDYSLLRPDFPGLRAALAPRLGKLDRILVFYGGSDPMNETAKAIKGIRLAGMAAHVDVVVGSSNPHREEISAMCDASEQFQFHCQVSNMAELMIRADLALGAGGITTWERCCVGLPALVTVLADNQAALTDAVSEYGAVIQLGRAEDLEPQDYRYALETLTTAQLAQMERRGLELVDGKGTSRVVDTLLRLAR
jgi:UDP-2,4-diacetamido-2,4,6-trideoxy-beta-L-altropyranose hydrolase